MSLDFASFPLLLNLAIFGVCAAVVWWAGVKLATYADAIANLTALGSALIGMVVLGGITSLPEIAVTVSAGLSGAAALATNNLLGGVALQVVILAIGDYVLGARALSFVMGRPTVLLQGVCCCLLLAIVAMAIGVGDVAIFGVGAWSTAVLFAAGGLLWLIAREKENGTWRPTNLPDLGQRMDVEDILYNLRSAILLTVGAGAVIFVAGFALARTSEVLAEQTGLGANFFGATLVGAATSLPEISTVLAAVRLKRYSMAFSDIFGTNIIDVSLIFLIDAVYAGGPIINEVGGFSQMAALLGIMLTLLYLSGLIERRDRTLGRLGIDSWAVLIVYAGGLALLYAMR
ncbi:sodium:calcium antiporter [Allomesorhizobium camelthorni]|uniref:Sodium:calcium antiporter n=1 Tax=Allomesorhizobium camelthorni TaxID=475069 RepID=A0A6G4W8U3_9HYPH|nr:sodium:calcium antiporter [Mesorhizobium camelthorni]NGO50557.1 sodium:calcium antiporter [Mesorhizobium camelthorni]